MARQTTHDVKAVMVAVEAARQLVGLKTTNEADQ